LILELLARRRDWLTADCDVHSQLPSTALSEAAVRTANLVKQMGAAQSSVQLKPAREPAALLNTGAGLIVRIPDLTTGESTYEHNIRVSTTPTSIIGAAGCEGQTRVYPQSRVAVARPGERNQALKGSTVYLKKAPRSLQHNAKV
jgi:hypothetical protein